MGKATRRQSPKGRYVFVLQHTVPFVFEELNCWGSGRWPRPNDRKWKIFESRQAAQDFLNIQYTQKSRRTVFSQWRPRRFYISIESYQYLAKRNLIIFERGRK